MVVTPTSNSSKQLAALQDMIAHCATFITWTGATDAMGAEASIFIDAFVPVDGDGNRLIDLSTLRPFVVIEDGERTYERTSSGVHDHYDLEASYIVAFEADVPTDYSIEDAGYWFRNYVDAILAEMQALTGTYIHIRSIDQEYEMTRQAPKKDGKKGNYFYWGFRVTVG